MSRGDGVFRRMTAHLRGPTGREIATTAMHAAEVRLVHKQDAEITAKLMENLGPVLVALQATPEAVLRVGALLVVKQDGAVTVRQLTPAQQFLLNHNPLLETSPHSVVEALALDADSDGPHLELTGDPAEEFPVLAQCDYATARVWDCAYRTFAPVGAITTLTRLEIGGYPDETLAHLCPLARLGHLSILHLPRVTDLTPLTALTQLRTLDLIAPPGTVTEVASLAPLRILPRLEEVTLLGVRPPDQAIDDLIGCPALRAVRLSGYPSTEVDRLAKALSSR